MNRIEFLKSTAALFAASMADIDRIIDTTNRRTFNRVALFNNGREIASQRLPAGYWSKAAYHQREPINWALDGPIDVDEVRAFVYCGDNATGDPLVDAMKYRCEELGVILPTPGLPCYVAPGNTLTLVIPSASHKLFTIK